MKRLVVIGFILLLTLLSACHTHDDGGNAVVETVCTPSLPPLSAIDSLMWRQPDSALMALQAFAATPEADSLDAFNGHYCQLLLSELLYKNYYAQTNRPALQQAASYFDSLYFTLNDRPHAPRRHCGLDPQSPTRNDQIVFLDARAHYINGVGYYERDSVVEACKEYLKALETMEERFDEKELAGNKAQFMALAYTRLTELFSDQYLHEQAVYLGKIAMEFYNKYDAQLSHKAWMLEEIGSHYEMMDEFDTAGEYYKQAITTLNNSNTLLYRDIICQQTMLNYKLNKANGTSLMQLKKILFLSKSDDEYYARCACIGEIYYHEKRFDSAWVYLDKVFRATRSVNAKKQAAEWLVEICQAQGREDEILEYASFLAPFATQDENRGIIKSQLAELCNGYKQNIVEQAHARKIGKITRWVFWTVGLLAGLTMLVLVLYNVARHRNKGLQAQKQAVESQLEAERHAHKMQLSALGGRLKRSNEALKKQENERREKFGSADLQLAAMAETYADEPICQHILSVCNGGKSAIKSTVPVSVYADIALTDAQKAQLKVAATGHYGPLFEKLKKQYPKLKEKDMLYCYLCLLGLDKTQIAVMTQLSYRTVWEREKRLQEIFDVEDEVPVVLQGMLIS